MVLPEHFLTPNRFGVKGGIESAFMSTTLDERVAKAYAAGDGSGKAGFVFVIQMGMVDRGADLSWASQYPAERVSLFLPLTGLEQQGTRVDGSVMAADVKLSVNLTAMTIEQVISKRKTVVENMCDGVLRELSLIHI